MANSSRESQPSGPDAGGSGPGGSFRGRSQYATRDLTSGNIPRNLWFLAWPQTVEGAMRVVDNVADLVYAGFLGTRHLAGIGVAQQYTSLVWTARGGIDTSMRAMVSRAIGSGDQRLANHVVFQAGIISAVFYVLVAVFGVIFTEPMLRVLGVSEGVIDRAAPYLRLTFVGQSVQGFQMLSGHALAAAGDAMTPMKATMVARGSHIVLSPILIFGPLGLPEMGLAGAAVGSMIANGFGVVVNMRVLLRGTSRLHLRFSDFRVDGHIIWQMLKVAAPASVTNMERAMAQLVLVGIVTPFGDNALAAYTITRRVEMIASLGSQGLGQASGIIVGQSLGARKPERAKETVLWAVAYVLIVKALFTAFVIAFPSAILYLFTRDKEFLDLASDWVQIQAISYLALGVSQVFMQSFMTAGDTLFPMFVVLVTIWGVQQPLAYFLTQDSVGLGQLGIAWAVTIGTSSRLLFFAPYFFWGRWLRVKVFEEPQPRPATAAATPG